MSPLGQKQTLGQVRAMSALPPKADIAARLSDVRLTSNNGHQSLRQLGDVRPAGLHHQAADWSVMNAWGIVSGTSQLAPLRSAFLAFQPH
jgi:hypothetical protein